MSRPSRQPVDQGARPRPARWAVGFMAFAAMTMVLSGFFQVVEGIAALSQNEIYLHRIGHLFSFDLPVWGGIHLAIGVLLMAAGFTLRTAKLWSRVVGIAFAGLSMIANFLFLPYYPVWSLVIIALDVIVIWALCIYDRHAAYGERMLDIPGLVAAVPRPIVPIAPRARSF